MRLTRSVLLSVLLVGVLMPAAGWTAPVHSAPDNTQGTDLYILVQAAERVRNRLHELQRSPQPDPKQIAEHQRYLERLEAQIAARRQAMGAGKAYGPGSAARTRPVLPRMAPPPRIQVAPELTETDEVAKLDSRLNTSLGAFDDMLLQEVELLSEGSASRRSGGKPGGRGASGTGEAEEQGSGSSAGAGSTGQEGSTGDSASGTSGDRKGERHTTTATRTGAGATVLGGGKSGKDSRGASSGRGQVPADIPDGRDDDVVARQIREAAENETDPALREKLWDEYRKYKQGAS